MQNLEKTVLSQYAQSSTMMALINVFNQWIDPSSNIDQFYNNIWNVDTATGAGLDVWGRIVGVGRVLKVNTTGGFFGFHEAGNVSANPFNSEPFYSGQHINSNFIVGDDGFRTMILAKALANICSGSIPAINQILLLLFPGRGNCYVVDGLNMTMEYVFTFHLTPVEAAIVGQSGILPRMTGVRSTVNSLDLSLPAPTPPPTPTPTATTPPAPLPGQVLGLITAAPAGPTSLFLNWLPASLALTYIIYISISGVETPIHTFNSATSATVFFSPGDVVWVQVAAQNNSGLGPRSAISGPFSPPGPTTSDTGAILLAEWTNPNPQPIVLFSATFTVPPKPVTVNGQFVYLWAGLSPPDLSLVIQPVLEYWGSNNSWQMASFFASSSPAPAGTVIEQTGYVIVDPGTVIKAVVLCTGVSGSTFNYQCYFEGYSETILNVAGQVKFTVAALELESYDMQYCGNYPVGQTVFQNLTVNIGTPGTAGTNTTPTWGPTAFHSDCGLGVVVNSSTSVSFNY